MIKNLKKLNQEEDNIIPNRFFDDLLGISIFIEYKNNGIKNYGNNKKNSFKGTF